MVMSAPLLQKRISQLAESRVAVEEKEGLLNKDDKDYVTKRAQRRVALENSLQEVAEKLTDEGFTQLLRSINSEYAPILWDAADLGPAVAGPSSAAGVHLSNTHLLSIMDFGLGLGPSTQQMDFSSGLGPV